MTDEKLGQEENAELDQEATSSEAESGGTSVESLMSELAAAKTKADENWDKALRIQAELENVRRRAEQDVSKAHKFGLEKFCKELLPVLDSLESGLEIKADGEGSSAALLEGMALTQKMFLSAVEKFGLKQINPLGEAFDPALHEAMTMQESPDAAPNSILMVIQKGYVLNERLVRPARVVVAKPAGEAPRVDTQA